MNARLVSGTDEQEGVAGVGVVSQRAAEQHRALLNKSVQKGGMAVETVLRSP